MKIQNTELKMENDILDGLSDIRYDGSITNLNDLKAVIAGGCKSRGYTELVSYLAMKLKAFCNLEESINPINSVEDSSSFLMEVSSFLKELGCPYSSLTTGHLSDRLQKDVDKLLLIDYLLSELMARQMLKANNPEENGGVQLQIHESEIAKSLKELLIALQFPKPNDNITTDIIFSKITAKLQELLKKCPPALLGRPAFNGTLSTAQWEELKKIHDTLNTDFSIRREMLIKRLDVTIQSFKWSDKTKGKEAIIDDIYNKKNAFMNKIPTVDLSDLLAARDDITIIEKTSNASVRKNTKSSINKVIIGQVPDRGGRPSEQQAPPPEMPSWQQRSAGGGGGRGGQGGFGDRGGHRGGGGGGGGNNRGSFDGGNSRQNQGGSQDFGGYNQYQRQDSRGGYNRGGNSNFQSRNTNYVDQYVQDNMHNQGYQGHQGGNNYRGRGGGRGRGGHDGGRSNYHRGGGSRY